MRKITSLTKDQEDALPRFREECRSIALASPVVTDDEMRAAVIRLYASRGLKEPAVFVFADPTQCLWARAILRNAAKKGLGGQLGDQIGVQLRDQLMGQLGGQLWDQLGVQIGVQLRDHLRGQLGVQLWDQLGGQLGDQLGGQLRDQLRGQLGGQIGVQIGVQLRDQLGGQLAYDTLWFAGGSEFYWIALYKFAQKIGVEYTDEQSAALEAWSDYARLCGPLYPYDGVAFVSKRPELLAFDDQQRLHSEIGPAMRFSSGYSLHAWHGVRVPSKWIDERDHMDPAEVLACENVEQRAAGMEIVGWSKAIDLLQCKVIDSDPDPDHGDLIELTLPGLSEPGRFLRAYCPRNGQIVEGVPYVSDIDSRPINTVKAAQAWSFGVATDAFTYPTAVS